LDYLLIIGNPKSLGEFFDGNVYFAGGGSCGHRKADSVAINNSFGGKDGGASSSLGSGLNGMSNTGGGGSGSEGSSNRGNG